jgi:hypothetical protein
MKPPTALDYRSRFGDERWIDEEGNLRIRFDHRPPGYLLPEETIVPGLVLVCRPWQYGDTPWHEGEPYAEDTTTIRGQVFNIKGQLRYEAP